MLLATVKDEFVFHCQSRNLSPKTTKNYGRQIEYLFNYLAQEYQIGLSNSFFIPYNCPEMAENRDNDKTRNEIRELLGIDHQW